MNPEITRPSLWDILKLWFRPSEYLSDSKEYSLRGLTVLAIVSGILIPFTGLVTDALGGGVDSKSFLMSLNYQFVISVAVFFLGNFLLFALIYFLASLNADQPWDEKLVKRFFLFFMLASTPLLLTPAFTLLAKTAAPSGNPAPLVRLAAWVWVFILQLRVIRSIFSFDTLKTIMVFLAVFLFVLLYNILSVVEFILKLAAMF
jgi:hypothetical protein